MSRLKPSNNSRSMEDNRSGIDKRMDNTSKIMTVLVFLSIAYGANLAIQHLDKPITKVSIEGEFKYLDHQELAELVNSQIQGGFITIDLKAMSHVLHQHPWVADVSVQRQWPTFLKINVIEEVPIARWGGDAFLNQLGDKLIIEDNSHLANLPLMTAEFGNSSDVMKQYQRLTDLLLPTGLQLSKLKLDRLGAWPHKHKPRCLDSLGKGRILTQKAIARVDGIGAGELRNADDFLHRQVGRDRLHPHPDFVGFIGLKAVQGKAVFVGVNGDRLDAQFCCATKHADGDFRAVGNEQLADGLGRRSAGGHGAGPLRR